MTDQKRRYKKLAFSLSPEQDAAIKTMAGPEKGGLSAYIQGCLTASPGLLAEELKGLVRLIEAGDTPVSVLAMKKLLTRIERTLHDVAELTRLREMLQRFLNGVAERVSEVGTELGDLATKELAEDVAVEAVEAGGGTKC